MKKIFTLAVLCMLLSMHSFSADWSEQFLTKYVEFKYLNNDADKAVVDWEAEDTNLKLAYANNKLEDKAKAQTYGYYINRNDFGRMSPEFKAIMIALLLEYDKENPTSPAYSKDKFAISNIAIKLLTEKLKFSEEPSTLDRDGDYESQMRKFIDDKTNKYLDILKQKGVDVDFLLGIADNYKKPD